MQIFGENASQSLVARLEACGWFPDRIASTESYATKLQKWYGITMHARAHTFLQQFGGLSVRATGSESFMLIPTKIRTSQGKGHLSWDDPSLYPIGYCRDGTILLINTSGNTFLYWDYLQTFARNEFQTLIRLTGGN
ncbi:MAG: SUKH-3 domain-containing protein [Planctomycetota bacterium]